MAAKLFVILSMVAAASALPVLQYEHAELAAPAHYEFAYSVQDAHSGDAKQQHEARAGDAVHGSYSLLQPDGVQRIVDYTADSEHGFNANVRYEGHPTEAPVAKLAYAAPVAKVAYAPAQAHYAQAPIHYAAPVAKVAYAAPVAKVAYAPAQVHYSQAPVHYAAPVAKLAYAAQPLAHVTYSSPAISYHH